MPNGAFQVKVTNLYFPVDTCVYYVNNTVSIGMLWHEVIISSFIKLLRLFCVNSLKESFY